jgi:hypothetical protein
MRTEQRIQQDADGRMRGRALVSVGCSSHVPNSHRARATKTAAHAAAAPAWMGAASADTLDASYHATGRGGVLDHLAPGFAM